MTWCGATFVVNARFYRVGHAINVHYFWSHRWTFAGVIVRHSPRSLCVIVCDSVLNGRQLLHALFFRTYLEHGPMESGPVEESVCQAVSISFTERSQQRVYRGKT